LFHENEDREEFSFTAKAVIARAVTPIGKHENCSANVSLAERPSQYRAEEGEACQAETKFCGKTVLGKRPIRLLLNLFAKHLSKNISPSNVKYNPNRRNFLSYLGCNAVAVTTTSRSHAEHL
jgi:hypothetical protein